MIKYTSITTELNSLQVALLWAAGCLWRFRTEAPTYEQLAINVTRQGIEPGYRAEVTKYNGGGGLDFYPVGESNRSAPWSWLSDQPEIRS